MRDDIEPTSTPSPQTATLGGGCFWCLDAVFRQLKGVDRVVSGFAGGTVPDPTYEEVCSGRTGHAEVVQIAFDPDLITYRELLDVFFTLHDPTTPDRQGADVGTQYRSVVLYHSQEQRDIVRAAIREFESRGVWPDPIVTQVEPLLCFYPADNYHQDYFARNPSQPYCRAVVAPKVAKLRKTFLDKLG